MAKVDGTTVVVFAKEVKAPVAVRYAWRNTIISNLYNKEFLPVSSFRTDDWDLDLSPAKKEIK
jgi:sialate O-acetylesterase